TQKHLSRDAFRGLIGRLAATGHALSLADIVEHCVSGEPFPRRAFAVTFDDGFENNVSIAAPILSDFGIPATFYVTSGFIEHNAMAWIDRIEYFMEHTPRGELQLPWTGEPQPFGDRRSKIALLEQIRHEAKARPEVDVDELARDIFAQGDLDEVLGGEDPLDRKMTWAQVASLAGDDLFKVGGHGHTHRIMAFLDDEQIEHEVAECLGLLAEKAAVTTAHFSYPEGLAYCYCDRVIGVLRRHGIICCPTAQDGTNALHQELFRLRRIAVI
ncbi:MAG: polysaccharide deacetylase family protein, partial [Planctomycetota bacterium]